MGEAMQSDVEIAQEFLKESVDLFNKHVDFFIKQDEHLSALELDVFVKNLEALDKETLVEMVRGNHLKVNQLAEMINKQKQTTLAILTDVSNCKDFVAFDDLRKKARTILIAQNMADNGKPIEEIQKAVDDATKGQSTSNIIVT